MTDKTKQALIIIAGVVVGALVVLFALALYQGIASVPSEVQTAAWGLLIAAIGAGSVYLNSRSNAATRENSNRNAAETQSKVAEVVTTLHNGLRQDIAHTTADLVNRQAEVVATKLADTLATTNTLQKIEEHTEQIAENTDPVSVQEIMDRR